MWWARQGTSRAVPGVPERNEPEAKSVSDLYVDVLRRVPAAGSSGGHAGPQKLLTPVQTRVILIRMNDDPRQQKRPCATAIPMLAKTGGTEALRRVSSAALLQGQRQIVIEHTGREYRLRITAQGKLFLTA
jgi:hemin uptake protein HemP